MRIYIYLVLFLVGTSCVGEPTDPVEIAKKYLLVDTHIDVPYRLFGQAADVRNLAETNDFDHERARAGGLDALFMSIYIPAAKDEIGEAKSFADELIDLVELVAVENPGKFAIATCTADVEALHKDPRVALPLGMENGGPIEGSIKNLDYFVERGIRYVTLTHSRSNHISDSSYDENEQWRGLSPFGKKLVAAMNIRGVMVDVSHISDNAFWQVISISSVPVIATHSSLRHFTPGWQRNMSDDMVRAIGVNGGVIQINFGSGFVTKEAQLWNVEQRAAVARYAADHDLSSNDPEVVEFRRSFRISNPFPYATTSDVVDHIDRVVSLIGIDHVGLGSDYDGVGDTLPEGLKDVSSYPNLVAELQSRSYSGPEIEKILGGNVMRVWREVEQYAMARGNLPKCRI